MSNGLYSNNSGLPTMTRSEYLAEYHDITTYFDKEKIRIKKTFPFFLVLAIVNVVVAIGLIVVGIPWVINSSYHHYRKIESLVFAVALSCVLSFPLGSLIIRMKQIKKKEQERFDDLESRRSACIDFGTYDADG